MILRDFEAATRREFDLVVVGGGIHGASLLQEAARRNLSACLCEADDFGGGTSWNSLRIVHGGLRYLQTLDLRRFFQSVAARRRTALQFPALVRPLECLMPLYGEGLKRPPVLRMAMFANDVLSARRNDGLEPAVRLPPGGVLDVAATRLAFPDVRSERLQGAACWSDYAMLSSERILVELLRDACRHGALALNYARVVGVESRGNAVRAVRVLDRRDGREHRLATRAIVNCTGPKLRAVARDWGGDLQPLFRPSLAFNLLLEATVPTTRALAVTAPERGAPVLFVVPQPQWGTVLAGTMHVPRPPDTETALPTEVEIERFLAQLNAAIPALNASRARVRRVFAGLLPVTEAGTVTLMNREAFVDHGRVSGIRGCYTVSGVKYTTAGEVARQVLRRIGATSGPTSTVERLPVSAATPYLLDANTLWSDQTPASRQALQRVIEEEAVQCLDDLVMRRANWVATVADLDRVRDHVALLAGSALPPSPPQFGAAERP